jgi:hypothetical protein
MSDIAALLERFAGESLHLVKHSTGPMRFAPTHDPAKSCNAVLWKSRGSGGWFPVGPDAAACAAVDLAYRLGLELGRREAAPEARTLCKFEQAIVTSVGMLTAAGIPTTEAAIVDATVGRLPLAEGQRDRRREAVRRAFAGLVTHHVLVAAGDVAATRMWQVALRSAT